MTQKELKASGAASRARSEARAAVRTVDPLQARFRDFGLYSARKGDVELLRSLGLRAFERVGHAVQIELGRAKPLPEAPEATIDVAVTCMPAQFWQFTVRRHERGGQPEAWRVTTGSGDFAKFWPIAVGLASGMFGVVRPPVKEPAEFAAERQRIAEALRHAGASDCSSLNPLTGQSLERLARILHERGVVFRAPPPLTVTEEEVELLREDAQSSIDSFAYPEGTPDRKQPTEWHEGRKLMALAERLAAYRKASS